LDPESWEAMNNLGVALQRQGRDAEAVEHFVNAARLDPTNDLARDNVAASVHSHAAAGLTPWLLALRGLLALISPVALVYFLYSLARDLYQKEKKLAELPPTAVAYWRLRHGWLPLTIDRHAVLLGMVGIGVAVVAVVAIVQLI
jgi:hypothetical protein